MCVSVWVCFSLCMCDYFGACMCFFCAFMYVWVFCVYMGAVCFLRLSVGVFFVCRFVCICVCGSNLPFSLIK